MIQKKIWNRSIVHHIEVGSFCSYLFWGKCFLVHVYFLALFSLGIFGVSFGRLRSSEQRASEAEAKAENRWENRGRRWFDLLLCWPPNKHKWAGSKACRCHPVGECGSRAPATPVNTKKTFLKGLPIAGWPSAIPKPLSVLSGFWRCQVSLYEKQREWEASALERQNASHREEAWQLWVEGRCVCICVFERRS